MRIPTLLGVALIITLIALSGLYLYYRPQAAEENVATVSDLEAVNIFDTTTTIVWQTTTPTIGRVVVSGDNSSRTISDNRDRGLPQPRLVHFATINNLKPEIKYTYQIKNGPALYPEKPLEFTTAKTIKNDDNLTFSFLKPLKGTILNTNLNPIDESLIFVEIPGAQRLATFSSTAGNFIMPLKTVLNSDLSQVFIVPNGTKSELNIIRGALKSNVKILISEETMNLPPIPIGSNLDLTNFKPQPITNITLTTPSPNSLDFNSDGKVNSLDLAVLRQAADPKTLRGTSGKSKFDVNGDSLVDQNDIDVFSKTLTR